MNRETAQRILADCVATYRDQSYVELAARLVTDAKSRDTLDVIDGVDPDGIGYTIEVNFVWDDKRKRHVRVLADISSHAQGCLFGFIPIFFPDASDSFIVAPDGSFIGE